MHMNVLEVSDILRDDHPYLTVTETAENDVQGKGRSLALA